MLCRNDSGGWAVCAGFSIKQIDKASRTLKILSFGTVFGEESYLGGAADIAGKIPRHIIWPCSVGMTVWGGQFARASLPNKSIKQAAHKKILSFRTAFREESYRLVLQTLQRKVPTLT